MEKKIKISKEEQATKTLSELVEEYEDDSVGFEFEPTEETNYKIEKIYDPIIKCHLWVEVKE